jgi:leucyl/phenylalanyl-tRNA--protein transferase
MTLAIQRLSADSLFFPATNNALEDPNGLLAYGGDLSTERLKSAYQAGIFPWFSDGEPIMWWSPNPRAIIPINEIRINRTLRKILKQKTFSVTVNQAFDQVIDYCADAPFRKEGTWIVDQMRAAYKRLHIEGFAHSIEVWMDGELAGGLYGVAINGAFSGESMFYRKSNASKIALVYLAELLKAQNIEIIDCQMQNPFLEDMGCKEVSRDDFIHLQQKSLATRLTNNCWQPREL